jgi:glycosyltransferase involved in cell wall biosynthesis
MRIGVVAPVIRARDAVGIDAIEMVRALRAAGHDARLFGESATGVDEPVAKTRRVRAFLRDPGDVLVYHYSFGWPGAIPLLRSARCRRVVKYHNVTPPEFFEGYAKDLHAACAAGRRQIAQIVGLRCERYLADSAYNLGELLEAGLDPALGGVLPPFNRVASLLAGKADLAFLDRFGSTDRTNVLMVGRIVPNKGYLELLDAFAQYRGLDPRARLLLVGKQDARLRRYLREIEERIARHGLGADVHFFHDASDAVLKSAYLSADVLMMLSRHEGFCVPIAEAMALGVPVVAHASSAIPDTVGDAGLLVDDLDPLVYALALRELRADAATRRALVERAKHRYAARYAGPAVAGRLVAAIEALP